MGEKSPVRQLDTKSDYPRVVRPAFTDLLASGVSRPLGERTVLEGVRRLGDDGAGAQLIVGRAGKSAADQLLQVVSTKH